MTRIGSSIRHLRLHHHRDTEREIVAMTTKTAQHQQGDVTFERLTELPVGTRKEAGRILAYGEATGHAHRLTDASDGLLVDIDGQLYLSVGAGGS